MAASNICWGIELGAGGLKALKLARSGDDVTVLEFVDLPHKRVLSAPDLDVNEATRLAISTLAGQYDLTGATIAISVPGHSAFARFAKLPPVDPKKIKDIVKFEAVQQIPFQLSDVEWDYQTFASPDSPDVEVGIFAMHREKVMERLAMWAEAGVTPDIISLSPVSAYNAIAYDQAFSEKTPGTVILDIGTTSTDLIVAEPGRMWIRTFPIGGHQFTEALVSAFKLSYLKAEKLKREAEASKHARHVFQAMRPVFSDLAQDVQRSIGYYQSLHKDANLTRLIGLGSTFSLPGLRKYLSQQLQMEVLRLEGFNRLAFDGPREGEFKEATLRLGTAYGLALQGLGMETCNANLMPAAVIREAMWKRKVKWFGLAAGLAVVGAGASFYRYMADKTAAAQSKPAVIEQVKSELRTLRTQAQKAAAFTDFKAANAATLLDHRDVYAALMDDFGLMMEDARTKALSGGAKPETSQGVGFMFKKLDTRYGLGAGGSATDSDQSRASRRSRTASSDPQPGAGGDGARIAVMLEVSTTQSNPEQFLRNTLLQWINDHKDRPERPYTLELSRSGNPWKQTERHEIKGDDRAQPSPESPAISEGQPYDERRPSKGAAGGESGGGRPAGASLGGSSSGQPGGSGGGAAGGGTLAQLAPLPKPDPVAEPGSTVTTFQVFFDAVLRTDQPASTETKP